MGELMSSLSLLFAFWGVLFGLWNKEINAIINDPIPPGQLALTAACRENLKIIRYRALPLFWAAGALFVLFVPETVKIVIHTLIDFNDKGIEWLQNYSAVKTAFCAVNILSAAFAIIMFNRIRKLRRRLEILKDALTAIDNDGGNGK